jgi:hypothetical protein
MSINIKFVSVKTKMPALNRQVLCRCHGEDKKSFIYNVGELIETTEGFKWLDFNFEDMILIPEEWSYLPETCKNS